MVHCRSQCRDLKCLRYTQSTIGPTAAYNYTLENASNATVCVANQRVDC